MTDAKPLTAEEIAAIKRYVSGHRGLATPLAAEAGQRLIATIEARNQEIAKLSEWGKWGVAQLEAKDREIVKLRLMLSDANSVLRSSASIATRTGHQTNWRAFSARVQGILNEQHQAGIFPTEALARHLTRQRAGKGEK